MSDFPAADYAWILKWLSSVSERDLSSVIHHLTDAVRESALSSLGESMCHCLVRKTYGLLFNLAATGYLQGEYHVLGGRSFSGDKIHQICPPEQNLWTAVGTFVILLTSNPHLMVFDTLFFFFSFKTLHTHKWSFGLPRPLSGPLLVCLFPCAYACAFHEKPPACGCLSSSASGSNSIQSTHIFVMDPSLSTHCDLVPLQLVKKSLSGIIGKAECVKKSWL